MTSLTCIKPAEHYRSLSACKQIIQRDDLNKVAEKLPFDHPEGRDQGIVDGRFLRDVFPQQPFPPLQREMVIFGNKEFVAVEFDFTFILTTLSRRLMIRSDLCSFRVLVPSFGPERLTCADAADAKAGFDLGDMIEAYVFKREATPADHGLRVRQIHQFIPLFPVFPSMNFR